MSDGRECGPILRWRRPGSAPKPIRSRRKSSRSCSASTRCACTSSSAIRDASRVSAAGWRTRSAIARKISPFASTTKLGLDGAQAVVTAIHGCVDESLAYERGRDDMSSSADRPGAVHHRTGQACPVCGDTVREVSYSAYTVNYCPTCQTGGKVLADNTTSKFLK